MRSSAPFSSIDETPRLPGPNLIAIGLAILIAAACWHAIPATTGFTLVALGATGALINQLRVSARLPIAISAHLFVYVSLYLLFVGAVAHSAMTGPQDGLSFLQGLDFGISAGLMTLAVRMALASIAGGGDAPARWDRRPRSSDRCRPIGSYRQTEVFRPAMPWQANRTRRCPTDRIPASVRNSALPAPAWDRCHCASATEDSGFWTIE